MFYLKGCWKKFVKDSVFKLQLLTHRRSQAHIAINIGSAFRYKIGSLQVSIHVVQNQHIGKQKSHWDKKNKGNYHLKLCTPFVGLAPMRLLRPNRVFSHDVTAAILVSQNNETAAMLVSQPVLWELNSFLMQTLSFVTTNLHRCWPREWKHSICQSCTTWMETCKGLIAHFARVYDLVIPRRDLSTKKTVSYWK